MVRVFIFLAAVQLVLFVLALISALSADRVRNAPRALWVLLIILVPLLGPLAYFLWGRPVAAPTEGAPLRRSGARPSSPDDDPDFLRRMNIEQSRRDRETLSQWEREFRQKEEE
jgi:phospholipase D-like protein